MSDDGNDKIHCPAEELPPGQFHDSATPALIDVWRHRKGDVVRTMGTGQITLSPLTLRATAEGFAPLLTPPPDILLQAEIVSKGKKEAEGQLIVGVSLAWFQIIATIEKDPSFAYQIQWRQWEEILAAAYDRAGWKVVLTSGSNDRGRDLIASRTDIGAIRILDQMKAYKPGLLVTAEQVRAMLFVLSNDRNASKGFVTTTSSFAPGVEKELKDYMPNRLELRDGPALIKWLQEVANTKNS